LVIVPTRAAVESGHGETCQVGARGKMKSQTTEFRDMLVGILKRKSSLDILKAEGWYHIPVEKLPKNWSQKMLSFYQGYPFGEEASQIRYFGKVEQMDIVPRRELFPDDKRNERKADNLYYKVRLKNLQERPNPILSYRPRIWRFICTSLTRFENAVQINDLFLGSGLEEKMWTDLRSKDILAEREWELKIQGHKYYLDFVVFCKQGKLAIETDGYTTHYDSTEKIDYDTWRRNEVGLDDWKFLHYTPKLMQEAGRAYLTQIKEQINQLGGQESPGEFNRKIGEEHAEYLLEDDVLD
jgi:very-short-patch-repair endonuclease